MSSSDSLQLFASLDRVLPSERQQAAQRLHVASRCQMLMTLLAH